MNSAAVINSNEAFEPNLKKDPRLVWRKLRARILYEASTLCNDITQNRGLLFFVLSQAEWRALPGNTTQDVAGNDVYVAGYDVVTAIPVPANNASAITVKVYDISTTNQREVLRSLAQLTRKTVNTLASDDISFLSDPDYGMINVVMRDLFAHMANKYGVLNQSDFNLIFEKLDTVKTPTQDFSVLAELHRNLHGLLAAGAGQISTEYLKTKYLSDALKHDPAGLCMLSKFFIAAFLRSQIVPLKTLSKYSLSTPQPSSLPTLP